MTLLEALHEFDTAPEALPDYPEQPGTTRCCGIPVVMRNGIEITCTVCGRTVQKIAEQWIISNWGTSGITFRRRT